MGLMGCIICPAAKVHAWSFGEAAPECCSLTGSLGLLREGCQAWPWMLSAILGLAGACLVQVPAALGELPEPLKNPSTFLAASPGLAGSPGIPGPAPARLAHTCTTPASQNTRCLAPIPAEPDPTSSMVLRCASTVCWKEGSRVSGRLPLLSQHGQHSDFTLFSASLSPDTLPIPGRSWWDCGVDSRTPCGTKGMSCLGPASWRGYQTKTQRGCFLPGSSVSRKGSWLEMGALSSHGAAHSSPGHHPLCFLPAQRDRVNNQ